jgi:hypothetical protein
VDCRNARILMAGEPALAPEQREALDAHLRQCAACRDDAADPIGRALVRAPLGPALPPPGFTAGVLARLPRESPAAILQTTRAQRRQHLRRFALAGVAVIAASVLLAWLVRGLWRGTTIGLIADGIGTVMAASAAPLAAMLASGAILAWLLRLLVERPTAINALGSATLATVLLAVSLTAVGLNDRGNLARARGDDSIATIAQPIQAGDTGGDVASLLGSITVSGSVDGSVTTLAGAAQLESGARVAGDVITGSGTTLAAGSQVSGSVRQASGALALGTAILGPDVAAVSPVLVRALAGILGVLLTLALAALAVLLWPQRTLAVSRAVPERPWIALAVGALITILLALLALPLLALLALTVIGLALVPPLLLLIHVVYVQGLAAVGQALGRRLTGAATTASALWGVAAQLVIVLALSLYAPLAGLTAFYLLASLGLGTQLLQRQSWI